MFPRGQRGIPPAIAQRDRGAGGISVLSCVKEGPFRVGGRKCGGAAVGVLGDTGLSAPSALGLVAAATSSGGAAVGVLCDTGLSTSSAHDGARKRLGPSYPSTWL